MDTSILINVLQGLLLLAVLYFVFRQSNRRASLTPAAARNSDREMEKLRHLRAVSLSEPLSEKTRPQSFSDIVGQEDGIRALKAALCGPNPQHVLLYGPPGVGKTCAARLVLELAKKTPGSPFRPEARFVEVDATCVRFDERSIADPLLGSVHDPIYQGAGALGNAGVPQPKPGAVTKASGGVLFLDEIGELHPMQMNKLLKVLEDRKVFFESAYYTPDDPAIPPYIHDIFKNGMPADFRLVGATTKSPQDIPEAIRSRCIEIFFRPLRTKELELIAKKAAEKTGLSLDPSAAALASRYASSGREATNIIQLTASLAIQEGRTAITRADVEWVAETCHYRAHAERKIPEEDLIGWANGLAVAADGTGVLLEIEALATPAAPGCGTLRVTGVVDEEEVNAGERRLRRKSTAMASVENVLTVLRQTLGLDSRDYDLHINMPGGVPVDGPSAGIAIAAAVCSAMTGCPTDRRLAMTGELSIRGAVKPVGGVRAKIEAAALAGAQRVLIPAVNAPQPHVPQQIEVLPVSNLNEALLFAFGAHAPAVLKRPKEQPAQESMLAAQPEAEVAAPQQAVSPSGEPAEKAFF